MVWTRIALDRTEYELAKREAASLEIPVAEFVRRAVREKLAASRRHSWMRYAGFVETGNPNSSQTIEELIYGLK